MPLARLALLPSADAVPGQKPGGLRWARSFLVCVAVSGSVQ